MTQDKLREKALLTDERIRELVSRWFPISEASLHLAYNGDIKECARDFAYHIAADQLSKLLALLDIGGRVKEERERILTDDLPPDVLRRMELWWYEPENIEMIEDLCAGEFDEVSKLLRSFIVTLRQALKNEEGG